MFFLIYNVYAVIEKYSKVKPTARAMYTQYKWCIGYTAPNEPKMRETNLKMKQNKLIQTTN